MVSYETILRLMPELLLVIAACWIYVAGAFEAPRRGGIGYAVLGLGGAGCSLFIEYDQLVAVERAGLAGLAYGPVTFDLLGYALRCLAVVLGFLLLALLARVEGQRPTAEALGSLLLVVAGLMVVATAADLIVLFLGLELITIPTYVLLVLGRRDRLSEEATVKYFFLSILSSALLLYGFSFLYGLAGSIRLDGIGSTMGAAAGGGSREILATLAGILVVAGLGFKIAIVPFHFYAPDVYQGTTNFTAAVLAVIPKLAGVAALVRLGTVILPAAGGQAWLLCLLLALGTMTVGNLVALWQRNLRRLLAYSSIAHAGYLLMGVAVWLAAGEVAEAEPTWRQVGAAGLGATWLYLVVYVAAALGTFAALVYLDGGGQRLDEVDQLAGLGRTRGPVAAAIALFMFSLAGIPPLAGFWGKLGLFNSTLTIASGPDPIGDLTGRTWFLALAIGGVLNAAVAAAYYLRVVAVMYFSTSDFAPPSPRIAGTAGAAWTTAFCAVIVLVVGLYPGPLVGWTNAVSRQPAMTAAGEAVHGGGDLAGLGRWPPMPGRDRWPGPPVSPPR